MRALVIGGALAAGAVALYVWKRGGVAAAGQGAGEAAIDFVGGFASGTVGAIGSQFGLPTPDETTTDAAVARYLIDTYGYFEASKWAGLPAFASALAMDEGSGKPPPSGSAVAIGTASLTPKPEETTAAKGYRADEDYDWQNVFGF